jgi:hypothetical protein
VFVGVLVAVRLVVAAGLVLGPWTDEPDELRGWDAERFQEIVDAPGRPYADHEVEYPPGAVLVLEAVAGPDAPTTQDRLVVAMFVADLAVAVLLMRRWGSSAGIAWLVLGMPLLPGSYLRFDLLSVLLAVAAVAAAAVTRPLTARRAVFAGALLAAAALVKTWPVVLLPGWLRPGRRTALAAAVSVGALAGTAWLAWGGVHGPAQVLGFRGATGWHVESTPGLLAGLLGDEEAVRQSGAYRLGAATSLVSGPLLLLFVVGTAAMWGRALRAPVGPEADRADALATVGATCLLLVTAPLLSPQYLLWVLPWAAIAWAGGERTVPAGVGAATLLTAGVLAAYGPPDLDVLPAQLLLLVRNSLLGAVVALVLSRRSAPVDPAAPIDRASTGATAGGPPTRAGPGGTSPAG